MRLNEEFGDQHREETLIHTTHTANLFMKIGDYEEATT